MAPQISLRAVFLSGFATAALFLSGVALNGQARIDGPPPAEVDLAVTKTSTPDPVNAGANITYTVTVNNGGLSVADFVDLSDNLPAGLTFVSLSSPVGWSCTTPSVGNGGTVECTKPNLVPSVDQIFTLVANVPAGATAEFSNTAVLNSSTFDPDSKNNSSTANITVVSCLIDPVVTNNADSGPGSLRQAIQDACPNSTITFDMAQVVSPITLTTGQLVVDKDLTISGPGANVLTVARSTNPKTPSFRIFNVQSPALEGFGGVTISGLTITNGRVQGGFPASAGGGVSNSAFGTVSITGCTLSNNFSAGVGGGISNSTSGTINLTDSTLETNTAASNGGGIWNNTGTINVTNSTLSGNAATGAGTLDGATGLGGGICNNSFGTVNLSLSTLTLNSAISGGGIANFSGGAVPLINSIIAVNTATTSGPDLGGTFTGLSCLIGSLSGAGGTFSGCITGNNPQLGALADNGGPTRTHLPSVGSLAINSGNPNFAPPPDMDQRGLPRVSNSRVDMGAVETNYTLTATAGTPQSTVVNTVFPINLQATVLESGTPVAGASVTFTPPGSGASGTFAGGNPAVVMTAANGVATAPPFTANGIAGSYNVVATAPRITTPATFALTNIAGPTPTPTPPSPTPTPTPTPPPPTPTPTPTPPPPTPTPTPTPPASTPTPTPTPPVPTPTPTPTPPVPTPTPTPTPPTRALNVSTRMKVLTGDNIGAGGFIITGNGPKRLILRAIGPSLTRYGIVDALADPVLELHGAGAFATITNDNWRDTQEVEIADTGIPPTNDFESAIVVTLAPGAYTAVVRGKNNTTGVALIEVYDLDQSASSRLANLSTRAFVSTGDDIVIAGFVLSHGAGNDRIAVRGLGPSLSGFGLSPVLADPTLQLRNSDGSLVLTNNDWQDNPAQATELMTVGLAPTNDFEAAIVANLPPDLYTALLAGLNNGTGIGLVEIYDLGPQP